MANSKQVRNKILITGGAGYVGTLLISEMHKRHFLRDDIICVDKGMFGWKKEQCLLPNQCYHMSVQEFCNCSPNVLKSVKSVIHLAGLSNDPMADFNVAANIQINYEQTRILVDRCLEMGVPRFIFASSASVYGDMEENICKEDGPVSPKSNYAKSKLMAENYIRTNENKVFKPIILRKGTLFGLSPRMRLDLAINTMIARAVKFGKIELYGGGENWRPLVHIKDAINLYMKLAFEVEDFDYKKISGYQIYNVVGFNTRISELGMHLGAILNVSIVPRYDMPRDIRSYRISGDRLKKVLIFEFGKSNSYPDEVREIKLWAEKNIKDLDNPIYDNIKWIENCKRVCDILGYSYNLI